MLLRSSELCVKYAIFRRDVHRMFCRNCEKFQIITGCYYGSEQLQLKNRHVAKSGRKRQKTISDREPRLRIVSFPGRATGCMTASATLTMLNIVNDGVRLGDGKGSRFAERFLSQVRVELPIVWDPESLALGQYERIFQTYLKLHNE